jgi:hypothetical protein
MWRDGDLLVVRPGLTEFPRRCPVTNRTREIENFAAHIKLVPQVLTWYLALILLFSSAVYLVTGSFLFTSGVLAILLFSHWLLVLVCGRRALLAISLERELAIRFRRRNLLAQSVFGVGLLLTSLPFIVCLALIVYRGASWEVKLAGMEFSWQRIAAEVGDDANLLFLALPLGLFIALVGLLLREQVFVVKKAEGPFFWLWGVGPEYLAGCPSWRGPESEVARTGHPQHDEELMAAARLAVERAPRRRLGRALGVWSTILALLAALPPVALLVCSWLIGSTDPYHTPVLLSALVFLVFSGVFAVAGLYHEGYRTSLAGLSATVAVLVLLGGTYFETTRIATRDAAKDEAVRRAGDQPAIPMWTRKRPRIPSPNRVPGRP